MLSRCVEVKGKFANLVVLRRIVYEVHLINIKGPAHIRVDKNVIANTNTLIRTTRCKGSFCRSDVEIALRSVRESCFARSRNIVGTSVNKTSRRGCRVIRLPVACVIPSKNLTGRRIRGAYIVQGTKILPRDPGDIPCTVLNVARIKLRLIHGQARRRAGASAYVDAKPIPLKSRCKVCVVSEDRRLRVIDLVDLTVRDSAAHVLIHEKVVTNFPVQSKDVGTRDRDHIEVALARVTQIGRIRRVEIPFVGQTSGDIKCRVLPSSARTIVLEDLVGLNVGCAHIVQATNSSRAATCASTLCKSSAHA